MAALHKDQDQVTLMSINATKAGMEGLDKAAINAIIEEASKGSKFYEAKKASQKRIDAKKRGHAAQTEESWRRSHT